MSGSRLIGLDDAEAWTAALRDLPHAFTHTHGYCAAIQATTARETFLLSLQTPDARAACPLAVRVLQDDRDLVTPYGIAGFAAQGRCGLLIRELQAFAQDRGYVCGYVGQHPLTACDDFGAHPDAVDEKDLYLIDLRPRLEDVVARMSTNRRRQIRESERVPISSGADAADFLVGHYDSFMDRKSASAVYRFSAQTLRRLVTLPNALVLGAIGPDGVRSASLFGYTSYSAEFLFNAAADDGSRYSTMLIWSAIRWLKGRGVPWLNLGGGISHGDSLSEFKRRFGSVTMPLRSLRQVYDEPRYTGLCESVGVDATDRRGWFPPFHRPANPAS